MIALIKFDERDIDIPRILLNIDRDDKEQIEVAPGHFMEVCYCFNSEIRFCASFAHEEPG